MNIQVEITKIFHTTGTTIYTSDYQKKKENKRKIFNCSEAEFVLHLFHILRLIPRKEIIRKMNKRKKLLTSHSSIVID